MAVEVEASGERSNPSDDRPVARPDTAKSLDLPYGRGLRAPPTNHVPSALPSYLPY